MLRKNSRFCPRVILNPIGVILEFIGQIERLSRLTNILHANAGKEGKEIQTPTPPCATDFQYSGEAQAGPIVSSYLTAGPPIYKKLTCTFLHDTFIPDWFR